MKFICHGYILEDGIDDLEIPCPFETYGEFKKKPSFFRCKKCWKIMIDYEKKLKEEQKKVLNGKTRLEFINFNASYWDAGPWGLTFPIAYKSDGEPFEEKYLDWFYKVYNPIKYEQRIKNRKQKRLNIIQEFKDKKQRAKNFIEQAKTKSALNKLFSR